MSKSKFSGSGSVDVRFDLFTSSAFTSGVLGPVCSLNSPLKISVSVSVTLSQNPDCVPKTFD